MPKRKITTETTTVANKKNKITKEEKRSKTNTVKTGGTKDKKKSYPKLIDENTNTEKVSFMFISFISSTLFSFLHYFYLHSKNSIGL